MRVAVIDIGTNSVRIEAFELSNDTPKRVFRSSSMPKLGLNIEKTNTLYPEGKELALKTLIEFSKENLDINKIIAVGTSALRQADDAQDFITTVQEQSGIKIEIITGEQEAYITSLAILKYENKYKAYQNKNSTIIDVGGGSTEIALLNNSKVHNPHSLLVGAITKTFGKYPLSKNELESFESKINIELDKTTKEYNETKFEIAFCSSGTARTIAKTPFMKKNTNGELNSNDLDYFIKRLKKLSLEEIKAIKGIDAKRADIILPGSMILLAVLERLNIKKFVVSNYSLRHGLLARLEM